MNYGIKKSKNMTAHKLAREIGYTIVDGLVYLKEKKITTYTNRAGYVVFTFRFNDEIYSANLEKFKKQFAPKSPNLVSSDEKKNLHDDIREYHSLCGSYQQTIDKFGIACKSSLFLILNPKAKKT